MNGKQESGASALEVVCGIGMALLLAWGLATNLGYFRQAIYNLQNIERCIGQLYNCSNT